LFVPYTTIGKNSDLFQFHNLNISLKNAKVYGILEQIGEVHDLYYK
jgi:hypothetical protein